MNGTLQTQLARLSINYIAPLQRHARTFWRWWSAELLTVLPDSMRQSIASSDEYLFVQISGTDLVVFRGTIERMQELARFPIDAHDSALPDIDQSSHQTTVILPPQKVLETTVTLPAATEENLREVLAFEMDQLTPFSVDDIYYGFEIVERSSSKNTIAVHLLATPRKTIDELLPVLRRAGLSPDVITTKAGSTRLNDINLLPRQQLDRAEINTRWLYAGLSAVVSLLLIAAIATPLIQKQRLINELQPQVTIAMEAAKEGSRLKQNIELIATGSSALLLQKEARPMAMVLINEMSKILPDDTWLTRIDIAGKEVQIQGQSSTAASLIGLLEESPVFENVRFRSPVTQIPRTDAERFHLSADWSNPE